MLPDEDVTCVLQDFPVALLLGQRLTVSELAKSKAKTPVGAHAAAPLFLDLVIVFFILVCPLYSSGFVGLHGQCFTPRASVFNVTIFGSKYVFTWLSIWVALEGKKF